MCYESTSCALALTMSPKNSSSFSTAFWIVGINWLSSPHSFNKQWTMPRPTYTVPWMITFKQGQRREKDSVNVSSSTSRTALLTHILN
jgi:hypothetical protein